MNLDLNPTQALGLLVFGVATMKCAFVAVRHRSPWRAIAFLQALSFVEVAMGLRWRVHDWADSLLQHEGWYASRQLLQWPMAIAATLLALGSMAVVIPRWWGRDRHASWAFLASSLDLGLFAIEAISLHQVDAILYSRVGPVMLVSILWVASAGVTTIMAWQAVRT